MAKQDRVRFDDRASPTGGSMRRPPLPFTALRAELGTHNSLVAPGTGSRATYSTRHMQPSQSRRLAMSWTSGHEPRRPMATRRKHEEEASKRKKVMGNE